MRTPDAPRPRGHHPEAGEILISSQQAEYRSALVWRAPLEAVTHLFELVEGRPA